MATSRTIEAQRELAEQPMATPPGGFGAEYRELARQRRFVRDDEAAAPPAPAAPAAPRATPVAPAAPVAAPAAPVAPPAAQYAPIPAAAPAPAPRARPASSLRISDDQRAMLAELARMSDRLVESREALATALAHASHLEAEVGAANDRLMAARALVHDAQHATRMSAERCAWLEGRCETLQEALDVAVHAGLVTRWRWRRQARAMR